MADGSEFDTRLVSFREHVESRDELKDRIAQIELEQAKQRAALMHLPEEVRRLSSLIGDALQRLQPAATPADHTSLAIHRALDEMKKGGGAQSPILLALALLGAAALGALALFLSGRLS